jgi:hypothetical protein
MSKQVDTSNPSELPSDDWNLRKEIITQATNARIAGKRLEFTCARYTVVGFVARVTNDFVTLNEAWTVFKTGELSAPQYENLEKNATDQVVVMLGAVESISYAKVVK